MPGDEPLVIDCDTCVGAHLDLCGDCVVSFVLDRGPGEAIVIDMAEARALRILADAELVPVLRHRSPPVTTEAVIRS